MDLKLNNLSKFALDNGYMPVEYIQTSGYPNINTGVSYYYGGARNLEVDLVINVISNSNNNSVIFDASNGVRQTYLKCTTADDNTSFVTKYYQLENATATSVEFNGKTHIVESLNYLKINDTEYTFSSNAFAAVSATLYLFKSGSTVTNVYSFKVRQSTTIIRDFIPAISYQEGHFGEACLYDKINNAFYYSASTGSFTASASLNIYNTITKAFVKDCPNVSGIGLLRKAINLERVRCNIGNVSGPLSEIQYYATLNGYSDNYEEQPRPRMIGTWTITGTYHSNAEREAIDIDGLTVLSDDNYNAEYLLANDMLAVQTLDSTAPNYNPAAAIRLQANGYGRTLDEPLITGGGRYFLAKAQAEAISSIGTIFNSATDVLDENAIVTNDNTITYPFTTFDEFAFFTGISGTINSGFNSTSLTSIKLPKEKSVSAAAFLYSTYIDDLYVDGNFSPLATGINTQTFSGTGTLFVKGNTAVGNRYCVSFANYILNGNFTLSGNQNYFLGGSVMPKKIKTFRCNGTFSFTNGNFDRNSDSSSIQFIEMMGTISSINSDGLLPRSTVSNCIMHLGQTSLAYSSPTNFTVSKLTKIYVGDGSSKASDQAIFDLYNADTNWATYCGSGVPGAGKIDLWWNYNGEYKWYYITDNLTNCTNTNPDAWPHITRGNTYETTIVPDEGMTLDSVTVQMLDTDTTSPTYDTMVDITSSVYDPSTGEISISSVTGNVVITASAS